MALNINTNIGALGAAAAATSVNKSMETAMERLSTGLRINTASDDAAGSAIASRLTAEIRGTNMAIRNAMDAQAMIDTAEGAHIEVSNMLQRMRELAVQSANDTNNVQDRANLQLEITQLSDEIDRIAQSTSWAGVKLLNGTAGDNALADGSNNLASFNFQIGAGTSAGQMISTSITALTSSALGVNGAARAPAVTAEFVGATGEGKMVTEGNKIAFSGKFNAGDVYSLKIADETMSITATTGDGYTDDAAGLAAQMADAIRTVQRAATDMADGLSVVDNGDGTLEIFASPVISDVLTTETAGATKDAQTFTYNAADGTFTVGGTHEDTDVYSFKVNGTAVSVATLAATNLEYETSKAGVVAQIVDQINNTSALTDGGIRAIVDSEDPTVFRVVQDVVFSAETYTPKTASVSPTLTATEASGSSTLAFANTPVDGDKFTSTINGVEVSIEMTANDGYDRTATGAALKFADAVQQKIDNGDLVGVSVSAAAGTVTIAQTAAKTSFADLTVIDVGVTSTLVSSYNSATGVLSIDSGAVGDGDAGNHENGDTIKFNINGVDVQVVVDTNDGWHDTSDGISEQIASAINANAELKAMGITATQTKMTATSAAATVTLAFTPQLSQTEVIRAADVSIATSDDNLSSTLTVNRSSFVNGDKISLNVEGTAIDVTINASDSSVDDKAGVATQIKAAIDAAGISGVTVDDNGDGTLTINKPSAANVTTAASATATIDVIDNAIETLNTQRAALGAVSNRLDSTVSNLTNISTNLEAGRSRIQDADFAAESTQLAKAQILQQASMAMLAQANASKQGVLSLLQG
ncbi:flagellin [Roseicyclus sp.]|uniref:flagellin N-terminal helical domain-containing protein n=1 Tax=Roseicyclus sp. TaxID=1914329 RepID=UPI00261972BA|nr:flagellin [Roseicyclus sp.]